MRKLLYLLPFPPRLDASHGGSRVMAQMLVRLAERHRVGLLYLRADEDPPLDERLCARCEIVQEVHRPVQTSTTGKLWLLRLRILYAFVLGRPIMATVWSVPAYREKLQALVRTWQPDLIQVEFHIMGQYLSAVNGYRSPRVLTEHEPGVQAAEDLAQATPGPRRLLHSLDKHAWRRYERRLFAEVDATVVFTGRDQQLVAELAPSARIERVPLQTVPPARPLDPVGKPPLSLLFVGNFVHPPNIDAAMRLVHRIFPGVQARFPEARLYIVGNQPPPELQQATNSQVYVTGYVPDIAPYLDRAAAVVVPLRMGGGMRVKILEAIAAGKAVVASSLALEGLDLVDGEQVLQAESDEEFRARINHLLAHPEERARLATNARRWACSHFNWNDSIDQYERLYADLLSTGTTGAIETINVRPKGVGPKGDFH
jgi:polysaccharide biosynthesis protein PslH